MKTAIIESTITPVEIPRFNRIQAALDGELLVLFQSASERNRNWTVDLDTAGFAYTVLPDIPVRLRGKDLFTFHLNYTVYAELERARPDVVIACGWDSLASYLALLYCRRRGIPYVLWAGSTVHEPSWRRTASLPLVRWLVKRADTCIAYGTRAKEYLAHLGADADRIFMGWNTVDNDFFSSRSMTARRDKERIKASLGIMTAQVVLYAGQLIERKGVHDLLQAFSRVKQDHADATLLMVGTGQEQPALLDFARRTRTADVVFAGFVEHGGLPDYFSIADVFVLPSHEEVWGLVINEAMACGLPVITTHKVGASADLVIDGVNGFVVNDNSPDEIHDALLKLLANRELRLAMGDASRTRIDGFTMEKTAEGVRDAVARALKR